MPRLLPWLLGASSIVAAGPAPGQVDEPEPPAQASLEEVAARYGMTPLHVASEAGELDEAVLQMAEGAGVGARDFTGMTPLHRAVRTGQREVAELLVANCADVDARDGDGRTPLHLAAARGDLELVDLLIAEGADLEALTRGGSTPLRVALNYRRDEVAELLRENGAGRVLDPELALLEEPEDLPPVSAPPPVSARGALRFVQAALAGIGYQPGTADGLMGPRTRSSIERFQRDTGQVVTGTVTDCVVERLARADSPSR